MTPPFDLLRRRLENLADTRGPVPIGNGLRGLEKESLRVTPNGRLAQSSHPAALGAALTHPWITTDFSESMVELVTPPLPTSREALACLGGLHRYVYERIGDELLWATSMPCFIEGEQSVPIARFGSSLSGRMREVYRRGLSLRYGRAMQTIAGVHFNFSPPEAFWPTLHQIDAYSGSTRELRDTTFFGLLRNYRRYGWLILYLFGASPAVCHTFFGGTPTDLPELLPGTFYGPHATTLRMSDIGYRNRRQAGLAPSMNNLDAYLDDLERAVSTPHPAYETLGVRIDGEWRQLSANQLQIENEFYGFVRPKQSVAFGERPIRALRERGVSYVEVRALDVNPFDPLGVGDEQMRFLEAFLWLCLLCESPIMNAGALQGCDADHSLVAAQGRKPGLVLPALDGGRPLREWAHEILSEMRPICELLDRTQEAPTYTPALALQVEKVEAPERTPSARVVEEVRRRGSSFYHLALELSQRHRDDLLCLSLTEEHRRQLDEQVTRSLEAQQELEATQSGSLAEYVRRYFAGR